MINMKEQIKILINLQEIETETARMKSSLAGVAGKIDALDSELNCFKSTVDEKNAFIDDLRKKYKALESDFQTKLTLLAKSQEKLTVVKTNKEYQSVLKEIDDIKVKNSDIEENMIEILDVIETAEKEISGLNKEALLIKERINGEKEIIKKEAEQNKKDIAVLEEKWNNTSVKMASEILSKYNMVRDFIKGTAIVPIVDEICQGCNMNIPPQMYNDLLRFDSIKYCPHCQRMIYWGKI
ncbi:zinc ribbon domain-containing protein [Desulfobacterium sp. N47]|uniref:Uncharacterized protein n=1 Tax=uncultured Desulfobacterium sp. TaxID=201089 RepID=E1Y9X4_9BACT|nr:hypothetical protein N47_H21900 [uncultured Desulfobacterium sp.]